MILVFGSINLDTIYQLDELPTPGCTVIGQTALVQPGGKGANQAVAAARDGATVAMVGAVGRDAAAETATAGLRAARVDMSHVVRVDTVTGSAAICVDRTGQNQIAVASGANRLVKANQVPDARLGPGTTLVLQMEVPPDQSAMLIRRARARGTRIILNLAPAAAIDADALSMVDWLVVNAEEAEWLGQHRSTGADPSALQRSLGIGIVRTMGSHGVSVSGPDTERSLPAAPVDVLDATGAGDCFVGVFAAALDRGASAGEALSRANAAAGLSCSRQGSQASLPSRDETDAFLAGRPSSHPT